jgi:hypothetical protein
MLEALRVTIVAGALGAALLVVPTARAADQNFCAQYAQAALNQVHGGLAIPRCAAGMKGPRWAPEYRVHYDWCLGASYDAAQKERELRTAFLQGCR